MTVHDEHKLFPVGCFRRVFPSLFCLAAFWVSGGKGLFDGLLLKEEAAFIVTPAGTRERTAPVPRLVFYCVIISAASSAFER